LSDEVGHYRVNSTGSQMALITHKSRWENYLQLHDREGTKRWEIHLGPDPEWVRLNENHVVIGYEFGSIRLVKYFDIQNGAAVDEVLLIKVFDLEMSDRGWNCGDFAGFDGTNFVAVNGQGLLVAFLRNRRGLCGTPDGKWVLRLSDNSISYLNLSRFSESSR